MGTTQDHHKSKMDLSKYDSLSFMRLLLVIGLALECIAAFFFSAKLQSVPITLTFAIVVFTQCLALALAFRIQPNQTSDSSIVNSNAAVIDEHKLQFALQTERSRLSSQVAHDIKSPLTALEILSKEIETTSELNPILVSMTTSAVSRIREISTDLQA